MRHPGFDGKVKIIKPLCILLLTFALYKRRVLDMMTMKLWDAILYYGMLTAIVAVVLLIIGFTIGVWVTVLSWIFT